MSRPLPVGVHHDGLSYRSFFPLGAAFAAWGALVWVAFALGAGAYPGAVHADLMLGGFQLAFAVGFLLTALPRFTGTTPASRLETTLAALPFAVIAAASAGAFGPGHRALATHGAMVFALALLAAFALRRFSRRKDEPPPSFLFVGVGLAAGLVGSSLLAVSDSLGNRADLAIAGRALLHHGLMPALVLGVGGRLFPALLGWTPAPDAPGAPAAPSRSRTELVLLALAFAASFPLELALPVAGRAVRAAVAIRIGFSAWRLHRRPPRRGYLPAVLRASGWAFVVGLVAYAALPSVAIHAAHLAFVGGLGVATFSVATRVILSHGGHGPALELGSKALLWTGILLALATAVRVLAFAHAGYFHQLALAGALWAAGVVTWCAGFLPRMKPASRA